MALRDDNVLNKFNFYIKEPHSFLCNNKYGEILKNDISEYTNKKLNFIEYNKINKNNANIKEDNEKINDKNPNKNINYDIKETTNILILIYLYL